LSLVRPGHPKGLAAECRGMSKRMSYSEMDNFTLTILPSYLNGLVRNATISLAGTERVAWIVYLHTVVR
jgi:hypothetical protein